MPLAELDGRLLAGAVWVLCLAAILPALPRIARAGSPPAAPLRLARLLAIAGSLGLAAAGALALLHGGSVNALEWWPGLPGDPFRLGLDGLSAPFVLLVGLLGVASFALAPTDGAGAGARARLVLHAGFVLALAAAFTARHALLFLLAWEGMTLLSAALVATDTRSARARRAAWVYLALSHAGAAFLAVALLGLAARAGSFAFGDLAAAMRSLPPEESARTVWLLTLGFAVKLGLVPLHVWLPLAHSEAPAPVSALLSGAMVKAGLYGLIRFGWQLPGTPPAGWGTVLIAAGTATALLGALYAVVESDAKRLLAYSTVKHAGLMTLALGLAASLAEGRQWPLAGVALTACLYHAVGHGLAKGLAFLAVGEAVHAAGTRELEHLGGLAQRMPGVALAALAATLALAGLPLLSCFAGEWLLFQAMIQGYDSGGGALRLLTPFAGAGLALATALAAAALVKLYGIGFLGRPRDAGAAAAHEPARAKVRVMHGLAMLVAAWGIGAPLAVGALGAPLALVLGPDLGGPALVGDGGLSLMVPPPDLVGSLPFASVSPPVVLLLIALFGGVAFAWGTSRGVRTVPRRAPSWACGVSLGPREQYSALGLTKPLRLIFSALLRPERDLEVLEEGSPYFGRRYRYRARVPALVERALYQPVVQAVLWTSEQARRLQSGDLHLYLGYLLAALVLLLLLRHG
jgi:formate hydrogenlyase subunit 3/multisubunit Na+/H+ antiporter MnhD subunit